MRGSQRAPRLLFGVGDPFSIARLNRFSIQSLLDATLHALWLLAPELLIDAEFFFMCPPLLCGSLLLFPFQRHVQSHVTPHLLSQHFVHLRDPHRVLHLPNNLLLDPRLILQLGQRRVHKLLVSVQYPRLLHPALL